MDWLAVLGIPAGAVLLYLASEWMVDGARRLALRLGVTPFVVGLTVVAFGSSAPEAVTSLASIRTPELIVGNIVGSNIANVGLAIGLAALLRPLTCRYEAIRFELVCMSAAVIAVALLSLDGTLGTADGILLLTFLSVFVILVYVLKREDAGRGPPPKDTGISVGKSILMVVLGMVILFAGARAFIGGAEELAEGLGVSPLLVGLIVVALGVSLPELSICVMAAWKGESEIVISNIVGSIIFNSFFALGAGAVLTEVPTSGSVLVYHMPVMVLMVVTLSAMVWSRSSVSRSMGAFLVAAYISYIAMMVLYPSLTF